MIQCKSCEEWSESESVWRLRIDSIDYVLWGSLVLFWMLGAAWWSIFLALGAILWFLYRGAQHYETGRCPDCKRRTFVAWWQAAADEASELLRRR